MANSEPTALNWPGKPVACPSDFVKHSRANPTRQRRELRALLTQLAELAVHSERRRASRAPTDLTSPGTGQAPERRPGERSVRSAAPGRPGTNATAGTNAPGGCAPGSPASAPPAQRAQPKAFVVALGELDATPKAHAAPPGPGATGTTPPDPLTASGGEVLRTVLEGSHEGVAVCDAHARVTYANPCLAAMLGCERADLIGRSLYEIIAPESHALLRADLGRRRRGDVTPVPYDCRRKDGSGLRTNVTGRWLTGPDGEFLGGVYHLTDVTACSAAENRFRQLYENSLDGIVYCDLAGRFIDCNPAYARMLGYTPDELRQLTYHDLRPARRHAWEARLVAERILPTDCSGVYEKEYRRKDGSVFPVELSSYVIRDERGQPVGLWGIARDISKRRRAADEITRVQAELRRNVRFLETLLEAIPTPVFYKDTTGRYLGCNRAFMEHTGVNAEALQGKTVFEVWPSAHAPIYHAKDVELLRNPARQVYEAVIRGADGEAREVVFSKGVFRDEHGEPAGLVGAYTDVTALKEAERAVRASRDYLQTVIDGMVEPVLVVDREYRIVLANAAARAQQGAHVLVAGACARCHEVVHGRTEPCVCGDDACPVRQVFATHAPVTVTHEHAEEGGGVRVVEIVASPVFDEGGAVVQVIQSYRDVTARRAAEERARQAAEERQRAARLSGRQRAVLELVARGLLNKQVAVRLGIAERTVEDHRRRGMQMLGVRSVAELVRVVGAWD